MKTNTTTPYKATHPGTLIADEIEARGLKQKDVAMELGVANTYLNEVIKGKRAITADFALLLEKSFGISAEYWMRFQTQYEIDQARLKVKLIERTESIELWQLIKQFVPVSIFTKLGLLSSSLKENISLIWEIYEVNSISDLSLCVSTNKDGRLYKKSEKLINDQINIFAWSKLAQWKAKSEIIGAFQPQRKEEIISELKTLFFNNSDVIGETKRILNNYGIKFFILEKFDHSPIDGYSFWSNENPAIVITLRKKQLDSFAFNVMHELGHVFEHLLPNHDESFLDIECPDTELTDKEEQAHSFARRSFIDDETWQEFFIRYCRFDFRSTESQIIRFASNLKIHPSIVLGRYCFESGNFAVKTGIDRTIH